METERGERFIENIVTLKLVPLKVPTPDIQSLASILTPHIFTPIMPGSTTQ